MRSTATNLVPERMIRGTRPRIDRLGRLVNVYEPAAHHNGGRQFLAAAKATEAAAIGVIIGVGVGVVQCQCRIAAGAYARGTRADRHRGRRHHTASKSALTALAALTASAAGSGSRRSSIAAYTTAHATIDATPAAYATTAGGATQHTCVDRRLLEAGGSARIAGRERLRDPRGRQGRKSSGPVAGGNEVAAGSRREGGKGSNLGALSWEVGKRGTHQRQRGGCAIGERRAERM